MRKTSQHLNDEHMRLYEWNGVGPGIALSLPAKSKRHTPLACFLCCAGSADHIADPERLRQQGLDRNDGIPVDQATRDAKEGSGPLYDELSSQPVPLKRLHRQRIGAPEPAVEKSELPGEDLQFRDRPLPA